MLIEEVKKLSSPERLLYWIRERWQIFKKRQVEKPRPWTDDEILQSYRFCNVRRIDDKVSQWLLRNWYKPFRDHPNMLLACSLARQLNNTEALAAVGFPERWQPERVESILDDRQQQRLRNYSAAYMITSNYGSRGRAPQTKQHQTVWTVCDPIAKSKLVVDSSSMERTWKSLLQFKGFSSFISGQVTADLRWAVNGEWADRLEWAPMGWGSARGINRYFGKPIKHNWNVVSLVNGSFLEDLRQIMKTVRRARGIPEMEAIDIQGALCELDKYERVLFGQGRPKQLYAGA